MKKALIALLLSTAAPVWALCPYNLDATQAQLDAWQGSNGFQIAPVISGQTMEFNVHAAPYQVYGAASSTGLQALINSEQTNTPMGDVTLPASGTIHVRMRLNNFPWSALTGARAAVWQGIGISTGNTANPLPKDSLQLSVVAINSNHIEGLTGNRANLLVNGQAISGNYVGSVNQLTPSPLPFPADVIGLWINMDTREMGPSVHISDGSQIGLAPGDYDLPALKDTQGNPYLVPAGVNAVSLLMIGLLNSIETTEPLIGAPVGATLETDYCGSSGPAPLQLPNGRLFKGQPPITPPGLLQQGLLQSLRTLR